ncbi:MAG: citramalate synthase [Candidatus Omnitrophica bacterium]|nr:citramalate synthase [Candidatus Omnitrophota bacterium]
MKVMLYDTTLRDGAQTEGVSFSVADKIRIAEKLDELGIHFIEGGWPGANPKDMEFFKRIKKSKIKNSVITAFGSTRHPKSKASYDPVLRGLLAANTRVITIFGKSWDFHVKHVFKIPPDENLKMISDSVAYLKSKGRQVFYDAEHFFDGYKANPAYAKKTLAAAWEAGASTVILCDTNGGTVTSELFKIVEDVKAAFRGEIGIHCHNDSDMAVANSIAAVQAGATQVQGTINGLGERCGNANLISIIANLVLKLDMDCMSRINLKELTEVSRYVAEVCNMKQLDGQPFTGQSAFAHKAGVHINAILKNPKTYEHVDPQLVGNRRRILVSELTGKSGILQKIQELEIDLDKNAPKTKRLLKTLQDLEHKGYHFEAAEASLELFMQRSLKKFKDFFRFEDFRVIVEKQGKGIKSEAIIKLKVGKHLQHTAALGDGPINALDNALRKALKDFYPGLSGMHLTDFKVRVLDEKEGTAAKVRVLVQSQDKNDSWWTIGVSENIIEASWQALLDSVEYKLLKDSK